MGSWKWSGRYEGSMTVQREKDVNPNMDSGSNIYFDAVMPKRCSIDHLHILQSGLCADPRIKRRGTDGDVGDVSGIRRGTLSAKVESSCWVTRACCAKDDNTGTLRFGHVGIELCLCIDVA